MGYMTRLHALPGLAERLAPTSRDQDEAGLDI